MRFFEDLEVVSQEISLHSDQIGKLAESAITQRQRVDDVKSPLVSQCGMRGSSTVEVHRRDHITQYFLRDLLFCAAYFPYKGATTLGIGDASIGNQSASRSVMSVGKWDK